jgi:hypothetical protein
MCTITQTVTSLKMAAEDDTKKTILSPQPFHGAVERGCCTLLR